MFDDIFTHEAECVARVKAAAEAVEMAHALLKMSHKVFMDDGERGPHLTCDLLYRAKHAWEVAKLSADLAVKNAAPYHKSAEYYAPAVKTELASAYE